MTLPVGPWTQFEISRIFTLLGVPRIFKNYDSRVYQAVLSVQSEADGGSLPDDSTQQQMRAVIVQLDDLDNKIINLTCRTDVVSTDSPKVQLDVSRGIFQLQIVGRMLINRLVIPLSLTGVFADYYTGAVINPVPYGDGSSGSLLMNVGNY